MTQTCFARPPALWAHFRFFVVGSLFSAPVPRGELQAALQDLADKTWTHPVTGRDGPVSRPAPSNAGTTPPAARAGRSGPRPAAGRAQGLRQGLPARGPGRAAVGPVPRLTSTGPTSCTTTTWPRWVKADPTLGPLRSYSTVRRYMQAHGWLRKPRSAAKGRPGEKLAAQRRERREIRSYEAEYVGSLWHLDFHHGSLKVLTPRGQWQRPLALGILDDHSRLCCHLQWYLSETAEDLVHGFSQAIQKRGLPRAADDRQRLGDDRRGIHAKGCCGWGSSTRRRCPTVPTKTASRSASGRPWKDA